MAGEPMPGRPTRKRRKPVNAESYDIIATRPGWDDIDWTAVATLEPVAIGRALAPVYIDLIEMVRANPQGAR
jgi:hypothetical protein